MYEGMYVEDKCLPLGIFLCHSPPYFLSQDLSLNLEVTNLARLVGQQATGILLAPHSVLEVSAEPGLFM